MHVQRGRPDRTGALTPLISLALFAVCVPLAHSGEVRSTDVTDASIALTPMQQAEQLRGQQRFADALAIYQRVLRADPRDKGAYTMRALTLSDLGSAQLAAEAVWRHPDWFSQQERERINNDRVARMIGWASAEPVDAAHRYAETDQALVNVARIERDAPPQVTWEATRLRIDRLIALNQRQRHRDVVASYQALRAEGIEVPSYVLPTVGDSLMGLRRPAEAEAVLRQALQHNPDDFSTQLLLGYALLEQERFDQAMPLFEQLAATQSPWPRRAGATSGYENWDRFSADVALAAARSAANDNRGADEILRERIAIGPDNAELHAAPGVDRIAPWPHHAGPATQSDRADAGPASKAGTQRRGREPARSRSPGFGRCAVQHLARRVPRRCRPTTAGGIAGAPTRLAGASEPCVGTQRQRQ